MNNIQKTKVVGLDFWDTIAFRQVHPETIIALWAKEIIYANNNLNVDSSVLYKTRKHTEVSLRKEIGREPQYSEIIARVYQKTIRHLNTINEQDFLQQSFTHELNLEKKNISLNQELINLVLQKGLESTIIIISDFYLGKDFIKELCIHLGIDKLISKYYISSDIGLRKSDGSLYRYVLKDLGISPENLTMIGDNKKSDQAIPHSMGINVMPQKTQDAPCFYNTRKELISFLRKASNDKNILDGYSTVFFLFIAKLYSVAKQNNAKKIFFCSREGQFLKKLFDSYQQISQLNEPIQTEYLYISRRATFLASLSSCSKESFQRLFLNFSSCSIVDFLDNLGFNSDEISSLLKLTNTSDNDKAFPRGTDSRFDSFLSDDNFILQYEAKRISARSLLIKYLRQHNVDKTLFMVDIGWRGSIQDNIFNALDQETSICGFYFGLRDAISTENNQKHGLIFDNKLRPRAYRLLSFNYPDLEIICSADHGPVEEYYFDGKSVIPRINNDRQELLMFDYIKTEQERLSQKVTAIISSFTNSAYDWKQFKYYLLTRYLHQLCCYRSKHYDYYYNYRKLVQENFGVKRPVGNKHFVLHGYIHQLCWGFTNYIYRLTSRLKISFLNPLCALYCHLIFLLKSLQLYFNRHAC